MIISIQYTLEITGRDRTIDDEIKWLFLKESTTAPPVFGSSDAECEADLSAVTEVRRRHWLLKTRALLLGETLILRVSLFI
jgi:hypothetical protein